VQQLLGKYKQVFSALTRLPPRRNCDHTIPLIPGAQPVSIRPYQVDPKLKDEIEAQVAEFIHFGMIKLSNSPFSSPVILVKKE
jgi:hypothetical protein